MPEEPSGFFLQGEGRVFRALSRTDALADCDAAGTAGHGAAAWSRYMELLQELLGMELLCISTEQGWSGAALEQADASLSSTSMTRAACRETWEGGVKQKGTREISLFYSRVTNVF